ncbi:MAG: hypothetical protein ACQKBY_06015 [Verrucomicrobiales bacterium]
MTNDKKIKIGIEAKGGKEAAKDIKLVGDAFENAAKDAAAASDRIEQGMRDADPERLEQGFRDLEEAAERMEKSLEAAAVDTENLSDEQREAYESTKKLTSGMRRMGPAMRQTERGGRNAGLAVLEFSRAVEDAQYGIRGVLNNIPQLVMLLGAGGGLAGAISLVAVGLATLGPKLVEFFSKTKDEAERVAEAAANVKTTIEGVARAEARYFEQSEKGYNAKAADLQKTISLHDQELKAIQRKYREEMARADADAGIALAETDLAEETGEITAEEAEKRRIDIRKKLRDKEYQAEKKRREKELAEKEAKEKAASEQVAENERKLAEAQKALEEQQQNPEKVKLTDEEKAEIEANNKRIEELGGKKYGGRAATEREDRNKQILEEARKAAEKAQKKKVDDLQREIKQLKEDVDKSREQQRGAASDWFDTREKNAGDQTIDDIRYRKGNRTDELNQIRQDAAARKRREAEEKKRNEERERLDKTASSEGVQTVGLIKDAYKKMGQKGDEAVKQAGSLGVAMQDTVNTANEVASLLGLVNSTLIALDKKSTAETAKVRAQMEQQKTQLKRLQKDFLRYENNR